MRDIRAKLEDYFSGPGSLPLWIMMAVLLMPSIIVAVVYL